MRCLRLLLILPLLIDCSRTTGVLVSGIYFRLPSTDTEQGTLSRVGGDYPVEVRFGGTSFDLQYQRAVYTDGDQTLVLVDLEGKKRHLKLPSLFQVSRPSFSWDGTKVAVQAREKTNEGQTEDINIYVVTLSNGFLERVGDLSVNEESPEFFWNSNRIAYYSYGTTPDIHIYDFDTKEEVDLISNVPGAHVAVTKDGKKLLAVSAMKLFDVETGAQLDDLSAEALAGLTSQGYELDTRFPGKNGAGTFPLDGDFSPDGRTIVLDGAVKQGSDYGVLLFSLTAEGTDFDVLQDPVAFDPANSDNHFFSLFNPNWL